MTTDLLDEKETFRPKIRRAKTAVHISLSLPPHSVGFFVLPSARVQVCIDNENETDLLLEEIEGDQNVPLSEEMDLILSSRFSFGRNSMLEEITDVLKEEFIADKEYYNKEALKSRSEDIRELNESDIEERIKEKSRKYLIDRAKQKNHFDVEKKLEELKKFISERTNIKKTYNKFVSGPKTELKSRLESKPSTFGQVVHDTDIMDNSSEQNTIITTDLLDKLIFEASQKFGSLKNKRDINMDMLKLLIDSYSSFETKDAYKNIAPEAVMHSRKPRDIYSKKLHLKSRLSDIKKRMQEKKNDILTGVHLRKNKIKTKVQNFDELKNLRRSKRDINMELLKVKTETDKKNVKSNDVPKRALIKWGEKEATLRKPGQTSDEIMEEPDFISVEKELESPKKVEVLAELADPDYEQDYDIFEEPTKSKNIGYLDRTFDSKKNSRHGKKKLKTEDHLQFLTSSEEITDIEDDLPCIHEFYGKHVGPIDKQWERVIHEFGEFTLDGLKSKKDERNKKHQGIVSNNTKCYFQENSLTINSQHTDTHPRIIHCYLNVLEYMYLFR